MAIFGKDYSEDFEKLSQKISDTKKELIKYHTNELAQNESISDGFKDNTSELIRLKQEIGIMKIEFEELKTQISELHSELIKPKPVKVEIRSKKSNRGGHISKMARFEDFAREREYDMNLAYFYSVGGNGSKKPLQLKFRQLVAIINGYNNGLSAPKLHRTNPILKGIPTTKIQNYIYIWRAGGFNKAIETTARKLGFNPKKLISHECDDL